MKKFVDDGMFLQMEITLIICQKKNTSRLHLNKSGSDTLPLRERSDFKQALSTLERLHQEDGGDQFAPTYSYMHKQGSRHRVRPLHGGNGKTLGGLLKKKKESQRKGQAKSWERTVRPVVNSILAKISEDGFQEFNVFCYRWIV